MCQKKDNTPFAGVAFPLAAELIYPADTVHDTFADTKTNVSRIPLLTKDQQFSRNLLGLEHQIRTAGAASLMD